MFFDTESNPACKPLPHNPFKACVAPRPIGWISTVSPDGVRNLAPYSFFNGVASEPPQIMYASNGYQPHGPKDTLANIEATRAFVVNVATYELRDAMNASCAPVAPDVDEYALAGLTPLACEKVAAPRIKESPVAMECELTQIVELACDVPNSRNVMVLGRVVGLHVDDSVLSDGLIDTDKMRLISRLGYMDYGTIGETFTMSRPGS